MFVKIDTKIHIQKYFMDHHLPMHSKSLGGAPADRQGNTIVSTVNIQSRSTVRMIIFLKMEIFVFGRDKWDFQKYLSWR